MIIPVILAGGTGTRLWPLSRKLLPKQFLCLTGEHTMLQQTVLRIRGISDMTDPVVICNEKQSIMVAHQLRDIQVRPTAVILEPVGRNTAPAVGIAALYALSIDPSARILILPADHLIRQIDIFHDVLGTGAAYAADDRLVTFGIVPDRPETGYGYIRKGETAAPPAAGSAGALERRVYAIDQFVEKPDHNTAEAYVASGKYCWNSGMFMFKAGRIFDELTRLAPKIAGACRAAVDRGVSDGDFFRLDAAAFEKSPSDSIDYAVMEKTEHGVVVPLDAGWDDLGSWEAIWNLEQKDQAGNVIRGDAVAFDVENAFVHADSRLVALSGVRDLVVVETADAVLIAGLRKTQGVRQIVDALKNGNRPEAAGHCFQYAAWGAFETMAATPGYRIRRIIIDPGAAVCGRIPDSAWLQWVCLEGSATILLDDETRFLTPSAPVILDAGRRFHLTNQNASLVFLEVYRGPMESEETFIFSAADGDSAGM
jgi:mannose-1-phosphate guanylyltransferase/mannose-6-phosphate isomerase